jgi:hypothetical protein
MKRRLLLACAAGLVSAAVWGAATRILYVPLVIAGTEIAWALIRPDVRATGHAVTIFARALVAGGSWAAVGMLVFR